MAYSFVAYKNSNKKDVLTFYTSLQGLDSEKLVWDFLSC